MTTLQLRKTDKPEPVSAEEQARAIANRDAIARKFGHKTSGIVRPDAWLAGRAVVNQQDVR